MIITRISGGLGNQMFQYAIAKAMARKNNDLFKLDVSFYPKQTLRKYELNYFNIEENIATEDDYVKIRGKEDFLFKLKKKLNLSIQRPKAYMFEKHITLFDYEVWDKKGDIYLDGFWQNEQYFKEIRDELCQDFTLKHDISDECKKYLNNISNTQSISLHVRRGDYIKDVKTNKEHGICDLEYYDLAIQYIYKKVENPIFYIFSDDMSWCKDNFHFLRNKVFVDDTKNALEDLELMKNCKHNIIANSTFSWWGAWLNENKSKIIVVPKVWFAGESWKLLHIALDEWKKV